jgi:2Fe-2S ferredoxin
MMTEIRFIDADGAVTIARGDNGFSLMEVAKRHGVSGIVAECGGSCACATCHVHVDAAWAQATGAADDMERAMLDCVEEPSVTSRLSCQIRVSDALDGLVVRLPTRQG